MKETSLSFCIFRLDLAVDGQSWKGGGPIIEVAFFCSLIKLRDGFVNGKFNPMFAFILLDFYLAFITSIITLKLITSERLGLLSSQVFTTL
jgi:hypothetical protein